MLKCVGWLLALSCVCHAQVTEESPGWFPFPMPGLAAPVGTAVDLSRLNPEQAGRHGFIRVADGHFVDDAGNRIRLFGTNITAQSLFLPDADAASVAVRLRQLGFNVLRLHMFDASQDGTIWKTREARVIDPEALRRLDFLIAECAKNGIYVNINLHAARAYPTIPAAVRRVRMFNRGGTLDRWYPPIIEMLEAYATQLFNHVNPYLGRRYAEEPAVACIEINNENTLIKECREEYRQLPEPYKSCFLAMWTDWLKRRYGTTAALAESWRRGTIPLGEERLKEDGWSIENAPGAEGTLVHENGVWRLTGTQLRDTSWSWQFRTKPEGFNFEPGLYTLTFEARSPQKLWIRPNAKLDVPPWISLGLARKIELTPEWQQVKITGDVAECPHPGPHRVSMVIESRLGEVEFRNLSLRPGGGATLPEGQGLESGVDIPSDDALQPIMTDYYAFLTDIEMETTRRLRHHLRETLGCRMPIIDTQVNYGGVAGILREATLSDYIDIHGYWNHPHFIREKGSPIDFTIRNTTEVSDPQGGRLTNIARYRIAGLPFSVSEYNTAYPSDYVAETFPLPGLFACLQDWDALYQYSYRSFTLDFAPKVIWQAQQIVGRSSTLVHVPATALLFRTALVAPWSETLSIALSRTKIPELTSGHGGPGRFWNSQNINSAAIWLRRVELKLTDTGAALACIGDDVGTDSLRKSRDGSLRWNPEDPEGAWFSFHASALRLLVGHVGGRRFELGDDTLSVDARPWPGGKPAYACISLVALDGKPLAESARMLLAASARTENQRMRWNETRTSVLKMSKKEADAMATELGLPDESINTFNQNHAHILRQGWGHGPILCEAVPLTLTVPGAPVSVTVLGPAGEPTTHLPEKSNRVRVTADMKSLWFLLER